MSKPQTAAKTTTMKPNTNGSSAAGVGTEATRLTPQEAKLVQARLVATSLRSAAANAGVPWATAWRIWSREHVQEAFYAECQAVYEQGLRRAQGAGPLATEALIKLLNTKSPQTRLSAATALLRRADIAQEELETKRRLDELERQVKRDRDEE